MLQSEETQALMHQIGLPPAAVSNFLTIAQRQGGLGQVMQQMTDPAIVTPPCFCVYFVGTHANVLFD